MKYLAIITCLLAIGCTQKEKSVPSLATQLDSLFTPAIPGNGPGGAFLIAKYDSVIFSKGYGLSDLVTKDSITTRTRFNLGSISKTFVSNAILILQSEGKLSVEDSLLKYFPGFRNKAIARKVRIKHLLTHTSGLPDNRQVSRDSVFYLTANDEQNWYPVTQTDTLAFEPGSRFEYSNPAFNALALIIEKVSGKKWQLYVTEQIFGPSSMTTSTITDGSHPEQGVAHAYIRSGGTWKEDDYGEEPTFCAAGNGGVWSSAEELLNYEKAIRFYQFLDESVIEDSRLIKTFPQWAASDQPFIGWSWFVGQTADGLKTVGHTGTQGGFYCNYVCIPDKSLLFVMLCNYPVDREGVTSAVMDILARRQWLDETAN